MNKFLFASTVLLLFVVGISVFCYKAFVLNFPLQPNKASHVWIVEAHLSFYGRNRPVKANLNIPRSQENFLIMDESFVSRGFGLSTKSKDNNRYAVWSIRKALGQQGLYYRAVVRKGPHQLVPEKQKEPAKPEPPEFEGLRREAAEAALLEVREQSADTESLVTRLIKVLGRGERDQNALALLGRKATILKRAEVAVQLLAKIGIPARIAHGLSLEVPTRDAAFEQRLEVWDEKRWKSFDLRTGEPGQLRDFLVWWYGEQPISYVETADRVRTSVSVDRIQEEMMSAVISETRLRQPKLVEYSLFNLPIETQAVYRIILLVPLGAFLVVILRNMIGIKTFGTFMPVLIALAFRETDLVYGIVLFSTLTATGLFARFYLEQLKLLLVPRLAAVLTIVVLLMMFISIITHKLGIERGLSVALFPMVILAMTIERMSIVWDELGAGAALKQGVGSLAVAALIYGLISSGEVQHFIFVFPELLLVVLGSVILLGRYSGFRLFELYRFRNLLKEQT